MTAAVGMIGAGVVVLLVGLVLARARVRVAAGADKLLVLGPVFAASALAAFAAEHFLLADDLKTIVPSWMPGGALFWTYFVGVALLAAAVSFIARRSLRWSALLLALLFVIIVVTVDLPKLPKGVHDRLFWTLTVRELCFAAGALVLAGSVWPAKRAMGPALQRIGRTVVACVFVFYAIQHFWFPRFVPGVPLEKLTPAFIPAPTVIAYFIGATLLCAGVGLFMKRSVRVASGASGLVLLLLVAFFYVPILVTELHTPLVIEGINYVFDTLLFAATALLAGQPASPGASTILSATR